MRNAECGVRNGKYGKDRSVPIPHSAFHIPHLEAPLKPDRHKLRAPRALPNDEDRLLAFEELVAKYEKKIYNLILRQIGDPEEAADLTQDTFVNAFRAFGAFRGESKISTWLCQIALNACKNRFRQRDRQREVE